MKSNSSHKLKLTIIVVLNILAIAALIYMFDDLSFVGGRSTVLEISLFVIFHLLVIFFGILQNVSKHYLIVVSSLLFLLVTLTTTVQWLGSYKNIILIIGVELDLATYSKSPNLLRFCAYSHLASFILMIIIDSVILIKGITFVRKLKAKS